MRAWWRRVSERSEGAGDSTPAEIRSVRGLRVLLIDDDEQSRALLAGALDYYGAEVTTVGSVGQALEVLDHCAPHVLVSHCTVLEAEGFRLIQRVRELEAERLSRIPTIALAPSADATVMDALRVGFQIPVRHPFEVRDVVSIIGRLAPAQSVP